MRDRRPVDELSIEELERVLAIRKRQARQQQMQRMRARGRVVDAESTSPAVVPAVRPNSTRSADGVNASAAAVEPNALHASGPSLEAAPRFTNEEEVAANAAQGESWSKLRDRLLLVVEVVAVFGLLTIGALMFIEVGQLQQETANAQELANQQRLAGLPTPQPTPIIQVRVEDYVLPGGHTVDASGNAQFNFAEFFEDVPSHLQTSIVNQVYVPIDISRPQPTSETALYLNIPKLGIDQAIVQGTDWEALKQGVGQVLNGVTPSDETGNLVLAAHNDIYGELFRYIDQLAPGDEFQVQTRTQTFTYRITGSDIVLPTDVHVMNDQGRSTVTLISCYPYQVNDKRYVVFAERVDTPGF